MFKVVPVFKIRINYKSGISELFEVFSFTCSQKGIEWKAYKSANHPIIIAKNTDDIESVWQVSVRHVLKIK